MTEVVEICDICKKIAARGRFVHGFIICRPCFKPKKTKTFTLFVNVYENGTTKTFGVAMMERHFQR